MTAGHDTVRYLADSTPQPKSDFDVKGQAPPGADKLLTILKWVAWTVTGLCVVGIIVVGGKMAISHRRGEGGEHAAGLAWVLGGAILVGSAASLVGMLT